jgi:hypothetical protein
MAGVNRGIVSMKLFANGEPRVEELYHEGTTGGVKGSDSLDMAIPIDLGEGFVRCLNVSYGYGDVVAGNDLIFND